MDIGCRNVIARPDDIIMPFIKLNKQNSLFQLSPIVPSVDGVEYTVKFMLDEVIENEVLFFLTNASIGTNNSYAFKPNDITKATNEIHTFRAYIDGPFFVTQLNGREIGRLAFIYGASPVYFCVGGHSNNIQTFSAGKIFEVQLKNGDMLYHYVPVEVDGAGKLKCLETGSIFTTTKDATTFPPTYGELIFKKTAS